MIFSFSFPVQIQIVMDINLACLFFFLKLFKFIVYIMTNKDTHIITVLHNTCTCKNRTFFREEVKGYVLNLEAAGCLSSGAVHVNFTNLFL